MGVYRASDRRWPVTDERNTGNGRRTPPRGRRRWWLGLALALVTLVGSGFALSGPAAADSGPTVVAPSKLVPGQTVTLHFSGFPPGDQIFVQLGVFSNPPANCCVSATYPSFGQPGIPVDPNGNLTFDWTVPTTYVKCADTQCDKNPPPNNTQPYAPGQQVYISGFDTYESAYAVAYATIAAATPPSNPCGIVHGSVGKELLAALRCTAAETELEAKCGFDIVLIKAFKALKALKTARGLYDLSKVKKASPALVPLARLVNDLRSVRFGKQAPHGFKTAGEVLHKLQDVRKAADVVLLLPDLARALRKIDYSRIARDIADLAGVKACVQGLELAVS
jgi:hypothetical protein